MDLLTSAHSPVMAGVIGSLIAGLATILGVLPLLVIRTITPRRQAWLMGLGAGVMLAAVAFSLLVPAIAAARAATTQPLSAASLVAVGLLIGAGFVWLLHTYSPHEHFIKGHDGRPRSSLRRAWLFVIAITLHNVPEGLSVGVGFGTGDTAIGLPLAIGIGLQNIPEGMVVAGALLAEGYSKGRAFLVALLSGLVEPVGGLIGALALTVAQSLLPWGLAFAAGAMLYVVSEEIIPESHRIGIENAATGGLLLGFVIMLVLDVALG